MAGEYGLMRFQYTSVDWNAGEACLEKVMQILGRHVKEVLSAEDIHIIASEREWLSAYDRDRLYVPSIDYAISQRCESDYAIMSEPFEGVLLGEITSDEEAARELARLPKEILERRRNTLVAWEELRQMIG